MQKLIGSAFVAMLLTFGGMGTAWSVPFIDTVDPNQDVELKSINKTYEFTHDITNDGFNPSSYTITSASIDLKFYDDNNDGWLNLQKETVHFTFDGSSYGSQEINTGTSQFSIATQLLQSDGKIKVLLTLVDNFFGDYGDVYFDKSTLTAQATSTPTPTPEPGTWVLMGTGLVGLLGYGWRRKQRPTV
jgi:hypothetical protein